MTREIEGYPAQVEIRCPQCRVNQEAFVHFNGGKHGLPFPLAVVVFRTSNDEVRGGCKPSSGTSCSQCDSERTA